MKPIRFLKCSPHLPVTNLRETLNYYTQKLGFSDEWTFGEHDGGVSKNELRLLFAEDAGFVKDLNTKNHRLPLIWFVDNIEDVFEEFKSKDIEVADTLRIHPYGLKEFAFIDINGYYIRVAEEKD